VEISVLRRRNSTFSQGTRLFGAVFKAAASTKVRHSSKGSVGAIVAPARGDRKRNSTQLSQHLSRLRI